MTNSNFGLTEWLVIGGVCGCLCLLVIAAVVVIVLLARNKKSAEPDVKPEV
jgi:hypothetical protein